MRIHARIVQRQLHVAHRARCLALSRLPEDEVYGFLGEGKHPGSVG